jgi:myo-inositol-1(or 4)-monophosphatase
MAMDTGQGAEMRRETREAIAAVTGALTQVSATVAPESIASKGQRDVVTTIDLAVEDSVRSELMAAFAFPVIGEELGGEAPADGSPYWLIDPICGTSNLAFGIPLYCINLALVEANVVTIAVVADPSRGEIAYVERGHGAWSLQNGIERRLSTSAASEIVVIEEVKAKDPRRERAAEHMSATVRADRWDFRSFGSSVGSLYLASGRIAAYVAPFASAVHAAAGALLATEAGATLTDIDGEPWTLASDSLFLAADAWLHSELLALRKPPVRSN